MSGHSKWATIKRAKGVTDAKRGSLFTKLSNAISIAVREGGGGDINFNFKLRLAVDKAKEANMPKDNIQRAIDKGLGKGEGAGLQTAVFEGFAPHNVAVIVETITDNTNRTGGELRNIFAKNGGNMGSPGSVAYMFKRLGEIIIKKDNKISFDQVFEKAVEVGAQDVEETDDSYLVYTHVEDLHRIKEALSGTGVAVSDAGIVYRPNPETLVQIADSIQQAAVSEFLDKVEDLDDVQNVFVNI